MPYWERKGGGATTYLRSATTRYVRLSYCGPRRRGG